MTDYDIIQAEYQEATAHIRQIDNRIWVIHGLYLSVIVAAWAFIFREGSLPRIRTILSLASFIILVSIVKMALVNHLVWFSDIIMQRVQKLEIKLGYYTHSRVDELRTSYLSAYKNQNGRWRLGRFGWKILTARQVMTIFTWINVGLWAIVPFVKLAPLYWKTQYDRAVDFVAHHPLLTAIIVGVGSVILWGGLFSLLGRYEWSKHGEHGISPWRCIKRRGQ